MSGPKIAASATWSPDLAAVWSAAPASAGEAKVFCVSLPVVPTAVLSGFLRHEGAETIMTISAEQTATRTAEILFNPSKCDMFVPPTATVIGRRTVAATSAARRRRGIHRTRRRRGIHRTRHRHGNRQNYGNR